MQMAQDFGLGDKIRFPNSYIQQSAGFTNDEMNKIYNAMDAFILLSRGEGFGLPIIEAQACGVPVIVTDWTACRELGEVGYRVPLAHREWTPQRSFWGIADPHKAADALLDVYYKFLSEEQGWGHEFSNLRDKAREFALPYDWQTLVDTNWKPFIQRLWKEVQPRVWGPLPKIWEDEKFGTPEVEEEEEDAVREIGGNSTGYCPELVSSSY
jgi:glycosyltransferase involved in cell wall biosynthesis